MGGYHAANSWGGNSRQDRCTDFLNGARSDTKNLPLGEGMPGLGAWRANGVRATACQWRGQLRPSYRPATYNWRTVARNGGGTAR